MDQSVQKQMLNSSEIERNEILTDFIRKYQFHIYENYVKGSKILDLQHNGVYFWKEVRDEMLRLNLDYSVCSTSKIKGLEIEVELFKLKFKSEYQGMSYSEIELIIK